MIAERARMDLHDHAVLDAHRRHLGQHLGAEHLRILRPRIARGHAAEQSLGRGLRQVGGPRRRMAVIGGGRAVIAEEGAPLAVRFEIAAPGSGIAAGDLAEAHEILAKTFEFRIDDRIGTIGRHHAALPARLPDGLVVLQRIERALRRGDGLDAEALEQARAGGIPACATPRRSGRNTRPHWRPRAAR